MKVFVLGTGGWGIALAMLLHHNSHAVTSGPFSGGMRPAASRAGKRKAACGVRIPEGITVTTDIRRARRKRTLW